MQQDTAEPSLVLVTAPTIQDLLADEELLRLFVDWVLADVSERPRGIKNPTSGFQGVYLDYGPDLQPTKRGKTGFRKGPAFMRVSDLVSRRHVAILVLRRAGWPLEAACNHVATRLYGDAVKSDSIKTGFEKCKRRRNPFREHWPQMFIRLFDSWLDCELKQNLFDNGIPFARLKECTLSRAEKRLGDLKKAMQFIERWEELAARAVILLASRIEKGALER